MYVADSGQDRIFAYQLSDGMRAEEREVELAESNRDPRGIWSDGDTLYVLDSVKDALFIYDLETGELVGERALDKLNGSPRGLWSDGVTLWVSDDGSKRVFAYQLQDEVLQRIEPQEFTFQPLLKAGNSDPRGIWSDGDVIFVADATDDRVYSYNMPDAIDASLASLDLSGVTIDAFSPGQTEYAGVLSAGLRETTVVATPSQSGAQYTIAPDDADAEKDGHQVAVIAGNEVVVTVQSADGSHTQQYSVRLGDCLTGLGETGLINVRYGGGSVDQLLACAQQGSVEAMYHYSTEGWVAYFLDGPEFINQLFRDRFASGLPADTALVAKREPPVATVASSVPTSAAGN